MEINRILVPLDGSEFAEQAIPEAIALAAGKAEIVFFQAVVNADAERGLLGQVEHNEAEVAERERGLCFDDLAKVAERWSAILPAAPVCDVAVGEPAEAIVAAAERLSCDLIVAASHGRGALKRWAFGSTADALARNSPVPVLIVRAKDAGREVAVPEFGRVVVPYDGSEVAAGAFPAAIAIAKRLDAGILLVHAVSPASVVPAVAPMDSFYPAAVFTDVVEELEAQAESSLTDAEKVIAAAGVPVTHAVIDGTPFDAIVELTTDDDLIVLASHGRSGFERWLLGSFSEQLVREGPVPVVVVPLHGETA